LVILHSHPSKISSRHQQPSSPPRHPPLCSPHGSKHGARALLPHGRELSPPAARRPLLLLPRAGQQLVHLSLPWRFPCEQSFFVVFNLQPSALPVLLARAPCSLLHGQQRPATPFFPSSTFPRALSPWPSSPRLQWPSVPTSSAPSLLPVSTLHSALWKAAALQLRAFPMAPPPVCIPPWRPEKNCRPAPPAPLLSTAQQRSPPVENQPASCLRQAAFVPCT
jgi:hypothetical protein